LVEMGDKFKMNVEEILIGMRRDLDLAGSA
jgi:hypothetical protein